MSATREAEWGQIVRLCARQKQQISDLNELVDAVVVEWNALGLTCKCDATKGDGCSVCEIGEMLKTWQDEREAEGPQE